MIEIPSIKRRLRMTGVHIHYTPELFFLSVVIGIVASEAALWLMIRSNVGAFFIQIRYRMLSALIMGAAICGMHYTGMAAAIFTPDQAMNHSIMHDIISTDTLVWYIASISGSILLLSILVSTYKQIMANTYQNEQDFLTAILTHLSDGVLACNQEGKITVFNNALKKLADVNFLPDSNIKLSNYFVFNPAGDNTEIPNAEEFITHTLMGTEIESLETQMITKKNNQKYDIVLNAKPIFNQHGEKLGAVIAFHNISEQKKHEEKLRSLNKQIKVVARQAGMADIATNIVHNIGNVLNSVNVSISLLKNTFNHSEVLKFQDGINRLLKDHENDFGAFINNDPHGKQIPNYLKLLTKAISEENAFLLKEANGLEENVKHIVNIISAQQALTSSVGLTENVNVTKVIEDALKVDYKKECDEKIEVVRQFNTIKKVITDTTKLAQIMINLIKNSFDALMMNTAVADKKLSLSVHEKDDLNFIIQVTDNGIGVPPENIAKIFSHGFTTKKNGNGFGLHSCANFANEMGGSLTVESEGEGKGTEFTLTLPYSPRKSGGG